MMTGTRLVVRMRRSTSNPESSGSMTSSTTRSTGTRASSSRPAGPVEAVLVRKPSGPRYSASMAHSSWSSSMMSRVGLTSPAGSRASMDPDDTRSPPRPAALPGKRRFLCISSPLAPANPLYLRGILQCEGLPVVVVGERLSVAAPADDGAQCLLGRLFRHVVLELIEEAALRCRVAGALIEHAADVRGERHVGDQVTGEQPLTLIGFTARKLQAGGR